MPALRAGPRGSPRGDAWVGDESVLTITKLKGAEYLIASVADGMEDYYMGAGEAPGVWRGAWAAELGVEGVVRADHLRALVDGLDLSTGADLLVGLRERKVRAVDVTVSVPKSVSLLWAFGSPETSAAVSIAVVEATDHALSFLEERTADDRLELAQRHPQDMTEVHDRQARLAVGVAPLLGHGVGLRPADAQHAGGFFHRQQCRKATLHQYNLQPVSIRVVDYITA